jgi:hypothetical protein
MILPNTVITIALSIRKAKIYFKTKKMAPSKTYPKSSYQVRFTLLNPQIKLLKTSVWAEEAVIFGNPASSSQPKKSKP